MLKQREGKPKDDFEHHLKTVPSHSTQNNEDTSSDVAYYTRFVPKRSLHHPSVKQVSPLADHESLTAKLNDVNVQRMIRIVRDGELLPSHSNSESLQKREEL